MPHDLDTPSHDQLLELDTLCEKAARLCEETRSIVSEYHNIVTLRQQCQGDFKANLYVLYGFPSVQAESGDWS